jgi:hypothetical protein
MKTNISVFVKVQFITSISITIMLEPELFGFWLSLLPEQYTVKPVYKGHDCSEFGNFVITFISPLMNRTYDFNLYIKGSC